MRTLGRVAAVACTVLICGFPVLGLGQSRTEPIPPLALKPGGEKKPVRAGTPLLPLLPKTPHAPSGGPAPRGIPSEIRLPGDETRIQADSLTEDIDRKLVVGKGFVNVKYLGNRLQADRVEINYESGKGVAEGNVIFQDKGNRILCERIEFNVRREQAILYGARGELGRDYKFAGERLERQDVNNYRIQEGSISTCKGPIPEWQFRSNSMDITMEEFAFIRHPTFWVLGFPVGYLPYLIAPIKTKRSTGFLSPLIGYSERDGYRYSQKFFWAFSDHADATFGVEYRVERGFLSSAEARYRLSSTTYGYANTKYLSDNLTKKELWRVRAEHRQEFGEKFEGFYTVELVSNGNFDAKYEDDLEIRTRRDYESRINVQKNWESASFSFLAKSVNSAEEDSNDYFQRMPDVRFSVSPTIGKLGPVSISPSIKSSLVRFDRREGSQRDNYWRIDLAPKLTVPLHNFISNLKWLTFSPYIEGRGTLYTAGRDPTDKSKKTGTMVRKLWSSGLDVEGPKIFRTYPLNFKKFPVVKHLTQLNINHFYRPNIEKIERAKIIQLDTTDELGPEHTLSFSWEHGLVAKVPTGRESFETREVVSASLSNSLNMRKFGGKGERPIGDISLRVESKPFRLWKFGLKTAYNVYDEKIASYALSVDLREGRDWFARHETRYVDNKAGELDEFTNVFSAGLRIWKVLFLEGGARWATKDMTLLEKNILLQYRGCCWGLTFEYQEREDDTFFQIGFTLVGFLGDEGKPVFFYGRPETDE